MGLGVPNNTFQKKSRELCNQLKLLCKVNDRYTHHLCKVTSPLQFSLNKMELPPEENARKETDVQLLN